MMNVTLLLMGWSLFLSIYPVTLQFGALLIKLIASLLNRSAKPILLFIRILTMDKIFFEYEPENWDIMISNPPFTNKRKYFERALSFNKPFALIMTNAWLNDAAPMNLFMNKDLQLLMFDKRMKFTSPDGRDNNKITFSSSYYCWNFLPKQIIMKNLNRQ
jgi:hypothetical protein